MLDGRITDLKISKLSDDQIEILKQIYPTDLKIALFLYRNPKQRTACLLCNNTLSKNQIFSKRNFCCIRCSQKHESTRNKIEKTNLERYGAKQPTENKDILNKRDQNNLEKYGVKHIRQVKEIDEKIKQTFIKRYGFNTPSKNKEVSSKTCQTNLDKYGNRSSLHGINQYKTEQIFLEKYGFNIPTKHEVIKQKISVAHKGRKISKEIKEKIRLTNLERYGGHPMQSDEVRQRYISTNLERYGWEFPCRDKNQQKLMQESLRNKIISGEIQFYKVSSYENEIIQFLEKYQINIIKNDRTTIGLELDIYIPEKKLAIEFNGDYWHSVKFKDKNYHLKKTEECEKLGIRLIHIWESEWLNSRKYIEYILDCYLKGVLPNYKCYSILSRDYFQVLDFPNYKTENGILEKSGNFDVYKTGYILL